MLVIFLSLYGFFKLPLPIYKSLKSEHMHKEYRTDHWPLWLVAFAFFNNRRFGEKFVLGLAAEIILQGSGLI